MLDGRVKTLHPKVHGGILARRDLAEHLNTLEAHAIPRIDLVVVNLYPFQATVARPVARWKMPSKTSTSAARRWCVQPPRTTAPKLVVVGIVTDPADYTAIVEELKGNSGALSYKTRFELARKAFTHTARYDSAISNWLTAVDAEKLEPAAAHDPR